MVAAVVVDAAIVVVVVVVLGAKVCKPCSQAQITALQ